MSEVLFLDTIEKHYRRLLLTDPLYRFAAENTEKSVARIRKAARTQHIAFEGPACRAACAELGILPLPSMIACFIKGVYIALPKFAIGQRVWFTSSLSGKKYVVTVEAFVLNKTSLSWQYRTYTEDGKDISRLLSEDKLCAETEHERSEVQEQRVCEIPRRRWRGRNRHGAQREERQAAVAL